MRNLELFYLFAGQLHLAFDLLKPSRRIILPIFVKIYSWVFVLSLAYVLHIVLMNFFFFTQLEVWNTYDARKMTFVG